MNMYVYREKHPKKFHAVQIYKEKYKELKEWTEKVSKGRYTLDKFDDTGRIYLCQGPIPAIHTFEDGDWLVITKNGDSWNYYKEHQFDDYMERVK